MTGGQRMLALVRSFPSLEGWERAWDAETFDRWASGAWATSGSLAAARFVLAVWSGRAIHLHAPDGEPWDAPATKWDCPWRIGGFDVMHALKVWDRAHCEAFLAWARNPWWV